MPSDQLISPTTSAQKLFTHEEVEAIVSWAVTEALHAHGIEEMQFDKPQRRRPLKHKYAVELLDDSTRVQVDKWISDQILTYAEIVEELQKRGHSISRSAIARYALTIR